MKPVRFVYQCMEKTLIWKQTFMLLFTPSILLVHFRDKIKAVLGQRPFSFSVFQAAVDPLYHSSGEKGGVLFKISICSNVL